jgi:hypothetical protein
MAELADAADSKSAGLRPLGVQLPLPAPRSNPFKPQLVDRRRRRGRSDVTISAFASDSAQTLTKLVEHLLAEQQDKREPTLFICGRFHSERLATILHNCGVGVEVIDLADYEWFSDPWEVDYPFLD